MTGDQVVAETKTRLTDMNDTIRKLGDVAHAAQMVMDDANPSHAHETVKSNYLFVSRERIDALGWALKEAGY